MPGTATLVAEVTNISKHCVWVFLGSEELPIPFVDFPWFRNATVNQIIDVQRPTYNHLYWPQLDIDISVESIRSPASFPLISKTAA